MTYKYDPDDKFGYKDTLPENHPEKVITGVEFDDEFKKIETGIGDLQVEIDAIVDGGSIDEAPANGLIYGRKDKSWVEVSEAGGAGIEEAPEDGSPYARKDKSWVKSVEADHTHDIDDVDGLDDALTDLAEKITAVTSDIVFGGTYDLANGVVLRSNKEFLIEGQPLPPAPDAPDVFLIVTSDGTFEGEALIRSDWIVSDGATWIPIPYSSSGSLSWDNIVDKPAEFPPASHNHDGEYAPVDHNHDADYAPIDHNHDADYQPIGDYLTEAPDDGKPYVRQSKAWAEMPSTGGGGGSLWEQNLNDIYYDKGNVGIGISTPSSHLHVCNLSGSADVTIQAVGTSNTATTTYMGRDLSAVNTAWVLGTNEHDFTFSRDGTERMRIDADGNVGIGTDNPSTYDYRSSNLVVGGSGDAGLTIFSEATSHARLQFAPSGDAGLNSGLIDYDNNDDSMSFFTVGTERIRIDGAGNVGIGTDKPASKLTIEANSSQIVDNTQASHVHDAKLFVSNNNKTVGTSAGVTLSTKGVDSWHMEAIATSSANYTTDLAFYSRTSSSETLERMRIDDEGRVGIGTQNPDEKLVVNGNLGFAYNDTLSLYAIGKSTDNYGLVYNSNVTSSPNEIAHTFSSGVNSTIMTMTYGGNVGIGNNDPKRLLSMSAKGACIAALRSEGEDSCQIMFGDNDAEGIGRFIYRNDDDSLEIRVNNRFDTLRIDSQGRVGIDGEAGTFSLKEAKSKAKAKIARWKAEVKKRTAEQPEASTQEITLEVTDGDFGVMPTEQALVDLLQERAIGGGDDLLQVGGYGYFAGGVVTNSGEVFRRGKSGIFFNDNYWVPLDNTSAWSNGKVDLGTSGSRFKNGYFSDSVNVTGGALKARNNNITLTSDTIAGYLAIGGTEYYSWNANDFRPQKDATYNLGDSNAQWKDGYFSGDVVARSIYRTDATTCGLLFSGNSSGPFILPLNNSGDLVDGVVDLGSKSGSGTRFKDAHFSGTIYGTVDDVPAHVKAITPTQIANWDSGTGGGGGATTDGRISDTQITNWDLAHGWGNHASAGYAKGSFVPTSGNTTISGTLTATDFVASSDERLKDNISPMPVGLIDDIKPVQWTWKESGQKSAGVIAQQLQEIGLDDFVTEGEDGMLGVNYNALTSVLLAEVIALKKQVQELSK